MDEAGAIGGIERVAVREAAPGDDFAFGIKDIEVVEREAFTGGIDREGQGVNGDVDEVHAPVGSQVANQPAGDSEFRFGSSGLTFFINGEGNN